jgi:hypothetical protein
MNIALSRREAIDDLTRDVRQGSAEDARRLSTLVRECGTSGIARQVLLLRLSQLPDGRNRPHHLQLATDALLPLTGAARAQLFHLPNQDHVVVWRGETPALQASLDTLRHLFSDDPGFGPDPMAIASVLALPEDAELVQHVVNESLRPRTPAPVQRLGGQPLDPPTLLALERAIAQADMSRFARREPICRTGPDGFRLAWERRFLSDGELFDTILPDRAPRADLWLFRRLTRTLDRRMLALLSAAEEVRGVPPFSVDLNIASLLGPEFLRFDANLPTALRGHVVVNLRAEDILTDLATFCFARDFAAARGYRLLLHDVGLTQLALLPPDRLGLDLVQLRYTPALTAEVLPAVIDPAMVVLGNADATAMAWGRAQGIGLYQGRIARPPGRSGR